ncbi:hypothetical protein ABEF95_007953 [Exophiala dermatitidis]|uniref:Thioesterase domain-containing protein n=2 Tax=Exophiala dermatitidis TaxID=5970 RepID=H6BNN0_EXODN|nr:uncharacterized protein HMPREF1120_01412 [Exophiala dermatitidis NIH/UT8656]EHY53215.1 hypothetical protein HMPREF1120_01412 [Exophiala dermatitidis NIH/UT8656]KAJ4552389.1 hypothetical protein HRR77_002404 [Exophiala dermatitidis]KAJ4568341.1 hypothetical protein HRR79_004570 [Exophiala dermatitidis]KAJ4579145.1 hypothetical protein HRR82_004943 [Exophiala dermatitidis]
MAQNLEAVSQSTLDHFQAIPWCSVQLSDPSFRVVTISRTMTQPGDGHSLMAETWNTDKTIKDLLSLYRPSDESIGQTGEVRRFYTFGTGLNAHPNLLHGGVVATLLDSTLGNIVLLEMPERQSTYTVGLNITYKKPIRTPSTILARSWIVKVDGRKTWVHGTLEDGMGQVYASAEGVWVTVMPKI